jgi:hypothetical protein
MLPEISHRCLACGASARPGARFCPQCGRLIEGEAEGAGTKAGPDVEEATLRDEAATTGGEEAPLQDVWRRWEESVRGAGAAGQPSGGDGARAESSAPPPKRPVPPKEPVAPREPEVAPREPDVTREARGGGGVAAGAAESSTAAAARPPLARPRTTEKGRRAAAVKESLRPRVERVRDVSRGVFEGAAEDSGLRFVIIAVALFLLFLLFLLLNNALR